MCRIVDGKCSFSDIQQSLYVQTRNQVTSIEGFFPFFFSFLNIPMGACDVNFAISRPVRPKRKNSAAEDGHSTGSILVKRERNSY